MHRASALVQQLSPVGTAASSNPGKKAGKYRYTKDGHGVLTEEQRQSYEKLGYVVIPKLLPEKEIDLYVDHFLKLCDGKVERPITMTVMRDIATSKGELTGVRRITKIQDWQDDEVLFGYCKNKDILKYVSAFCGPNIKSIHTMVIQKPPNIGETGRHPFHQDLHYFPFRPADDIVCSWTAMEKVSRINGCLSVLPGTHADTPYGVLKEHSYPEFDVNGMYHGITNFNDFDKRVHLEMEKGDTVFFHPLLVHGSGANTSDHYRKAISCHYASADCHYIDTTGTSQAVIASEVEDIAKRKLAGLGLEMPVKFNDVWAMKSRLVQGNLGTL